MIEKCSKIFIALKFVNWLNHKKYCTIALINNNFKNNDISKAAKSKIQSIIEIYMLNFQKIVKC